MKKLCCIVGAGDMRDTNLVIPEEAFIIAADAGLEHLQALSISPDLIVGDFDSLGEIPAGDNIVAHNPEKDDTDMMLAVKEAFKRKAETFIIYGGLGGRLDHVIANIQTLSYISDNGGIGYLIGSGIICTVIKNGGLSFSDKMKGTISVFCLGNEARGVNLIGLKYPLTNYTMTCSIPIGVSNEFAGIPSSVSVEEGSIIVMWNDEYFDPEKFKMI